jgi:hypothetical protein
MIRRSRQSPRGPRFLLAGLLLLLFLLPFLEQARRPVLITAVITSVLVAGVVAIDASRREVRTASGLAALHVLMAGASLLTGLSTAAFTTIIWSGLAALALLFIYSLYLVLRFVLQSRTITGDQVYAGICAYLMIGYSFGSLYYLVDILNPNAFAPGSTQTAAKAGPDLMYFSFVTLATVGYGDVTPATAFVRSLAQLEALTGTLYMATFMARLVSLQSAGPNRQ